jgi:thiamine transporter ThiT
MLVPTIIVLLSLFKKRNWDFLETIIYLMLPIIIIILTSGVTWGQGDRIILPILPLWIALYSVVLTLNLKQKREKKLTIRLS